MKETKELIERWMQFAKEDLIVGKQILLSEFPVYRSVCFQCQQSIEKYLKAYQIRFEIRIIKTHDLVSILNTLIDFDKNVEQFKEKSREVTNYAVSYRYPDDVEDITKQEVEEAILLATEVEKYITEKIVL